MGTMASPLLLLLPTLLQISLACALKATALPAIWPTCPTIPLACSPSAPSSFSTSTLTCAVPTRTVTSAAPTTSASAHGPPTTPKSGDPTTSPADLSARTSSRATSLSQTHQAHEQGSLRS